MRAKSAEDQSEGASVAAVPLHWRRRAQNGSKKPILTSSRQKMFIRRSRCKSRRAYFEQGMGPVPGMPCSRLVRILGTLIVFNLSQTEGINVPPSVLAEIRTNDPIETCERIVATMPNPPAFEQSDKAWYSASADTVGLPARGQSPFGKKV